MVKEHLNCHYIRGWRHDTVKGIPNELFYLLELLGTENFLAPVSAQQGNHITENYYTVTKNTNERQEYFQYAFQATGLLKLQNWREALYLYHDLLRFASILLQF